MKSIDVPAGKLDLVMIRHWLQAQLVHPIRNAAILACVVAVGTIFIPNQYASEARLIPVPSASMGGASASSLASTTAALGISLPGQDSSDLAYQDILKSRWLQKKLILTTYTFDTHPMAWFKKHHQETLYHFLRVKNMDRALKKVDKMISIKRDLRSKMITITVETESPELSQQMAVCATHLLEEFNLEKNQTRGTKKALFTASRLADANVTYLQFEDELRKFMETHRNYQTSTEPSVRLKGLRLENDLKLCQQRVTTLTLNHEQALLEEKNDLPVLNILDEGDVALEKDFPPRSLLVVIFFLAALITGIYLANRVKEPESSPKIV